jgi:hypothetical protein
MNRQSGLARKVDAAAISGQERGHVGRLPCWLNSRRSEMGGDVLA